MEPIEPSHFRQQVDDAPIIETFSIPDHSTLKVALEPGYSIQFDDLPRKFQIRIMDSRSPSPLRIRDAVSNPAPQWMSDFGPLRWEGDTGRVVRLPPSPSRSREEMQKDLRDDLRENLVPAGFKETICEKCGGTSGIERMPEERIGEERIFLRKPSVPYLSTIDEKRNSLRPSASASSLDFIDCRRPSQSFQRTDLMVHALDIHEIHSNLPPNIQPKAQETAQPEAERTPQAHTSEPAKMPPDESYNAEKYSSPPESPRSASPGRCTWHREYSCPVWAGYRCRDNTGSESPVGESPGGGSDSEGERCSYHRHLSCPATAGIRCRCERSNSPPTDRSPQGDRNKELGSNPDKDVISNSCKCQEASSRRPPQEPISLLSPQPIDVPLPSCHCEGKH